WGRAWLLGLAAGLVLQFALYSHGPAWMGAVLVCCMGGVLDATARRSGRRWNPALSHGRRF
ncbi:MAG: hypothetical protein WCE75_06070, partial [Terracidiphilus sp.]